MTDPNTALHKCQEQLKEAQEKHNKDSELLAWDELGVLQCSMGQYSESIECFQNVANIAKESKQSDTEGRAYFKIAQAYNLLNTYAESIEYYNKCISTLTGKGDFKTERMAYYNIGIQYFMLGNDIQSIEYLETSLNMAVTAADRHVEKGCCFYLGNSNLSLGRYEKAIFYFQRTLWLCKETGDFFKPKEEITCRLGDAYDACGKYGEATKHHKQSLEYAIQSDNKVIEKELYMRLVSESNRLHDYPKAVEYCKKYQNLAKVTGDKKGEAYGYRNAGIAYSAINDNESALNCFQNSLRIAIEVEDKELVEYEYANVATVYYKLRKFKQAIEHFEKSLAYSIERGNHTKEWETYADIGKAYFDLGSHKQAIECLNKCLVISRGISDKGREQMDLLLIGEAHNVLGNYKDAIASYERCRSLAIETGNKNNEETTIYRLGTLYAKLNYHKKAIEFLEKRLRAAVQKRDRLDEANTSVELANVYVAIARYDEAYEILDKTMRIAVEVGDIGLQSTAHLNLSHVHYVLENKTEQHKHLLESVRLAEKCGDETMQIMAYRALVVEAMESNDYMNALEFAKKELQLANGSINKFDQQFANYDIGYAYYLTGNFQDARTHIEKCLDLAKEIGDRSMEARTYEYLGNIYRGENVANATEKAFQCYEKQLNLVREIEDKSRIGYAYNNLGTLFLHLYLKEKSTKQKEMAESYFKESLRSYDLFFRDLKENEERKINVIEKFLCVHKKLAELYIENGEFEKALFVSEQEQGRALEDILKRRYMLVDANKLTYDFLGYDDIKSTVLSPDTCILFFSSMESRTNFEFQVGTWVLTLAEQVTFYRNELQHIKSLLQKNELDEYVEKRSGDILNAIVDRAYTTISLQRSTDSEDRSFSIHRYTGAGSATLDSHDSNKRCVYDEELNENYLEVLYDTLIAPVLDKLIHEEIVIVPNGPLFKVPFAALRNPQTGSFLSETKRLRIAPSLTTLKIMKELSSKSHSLTGALIVGDPDVDGKRILRGKERSFHSLPNARLEAERIGKVLGVEALTGKQASKQVLIERLRQGVAVIHLAAHGCAETGEIILSPSADHPTDKIPEEEDYLLTINEVQQIGLRARLVVLSCCHSGRGKIKSEGVIGMSRAFLAAGALAVVASLWAVDDEGTRVFMEQFYTHLKQGKTASASLQQAMKDMRNMPRFNKPMYWAPFVLIGDDVTINID